MLRTYIIELQLKKYIHDFKFEEKSEWQDAIIKFAEENNMSFDKSEDDDYIDLSSSEDGSEVKLRTRFFELSSNSSKVIECIKMGGEKLPFMSVFCNLNNYLASDRLISCE